mmetsp:Transcript_23387/g.37584  ORF Transcript_23387/g.37584 Transcript_23387/m.37584 type:complete len:210 (-) Transcript_23387:1041-1670(-)
MPDVCIASLSLYAAVPGVVVVVAAVLTVAGVLLAVVRHQVPQGEAVVGGDEVDGVERATPVVLEKVRAAADPRGKVTLHASISLDEAANGVAEHPVPLRPARRSTGRKLAHEVAVGPRAVPRLCDELGAGELRVAAHHPDDGRIHGYLAVAPSAEARRKVETKAVDVHFLDPVAKAVAYPLCAQRVICVHGVSAPGVVRVFALAQDIVF